MKRASGNLLYYFSYHFKKTKTSYFWIVICLGCGLALGIALHFTSRIGSFFLNSTDQQIFDFITKDVSIVKFFLSKLGNLLVAFLILFALTLSVYSSFFAFAFFLYQGFLFSASCCQIISCYGLMGIVNVIVILIPINLILFAVMAYFASVCFERTYLASRYKMPFAYSFSYKKLFWREIGFAVLFGVVFILVVSIVCSILLRGVSFVIF